MKKNYFLTILMVIVAFSSFAQLGTTTFNTATDVGSSYTSGTWVDGSNLGTGFSTWTLTNVGTSGRYIGGTAQGADSFGVYSDGGGNYSSAERNLSSDLKMGETFSVNVGHTATVNGEVFVQFLDDGVAVFTLKFVGGDDRWRMNDGGSDFDSGQLYSANTSLAFTFTYNEDGTYSYTFGSGSGNNIAAVNTISGINSVKFQSTNQGGSQNFGFNNLSINSKYTIANASTVASDADITVPYLTVESGSTVNIGTTSGVLVSGNLDVDAAGALNIASGSSLRVSGTSSGNITYNVHVGDTDWHLVSSPVNGEQYNDAWVTANSIPSGTEDTGNRAIATYDNGAPDLIDSDGGATNDSATGYWRYFEGGTDVTFGSGVGYSLKRSASGDYSFTGTYPDGAVTPAISQGTGTGATNWNLIGNPYPSYIDIATFITANTVTNDNLSDAYPAVYFWNASTSSYTTAITSGKIHPGQAFFINSKVNGNASITEVQSHNTGITFYKNSNPTINLNISNGNISRTTQVNYLEGKTASLDKGFDLGMFNGVSSNLRIYTHLISNDEGIAFAKQALPNSDYENMVVPLGVIANAGEITFTAEALNLPQDIKVFLEDRTANTFTRLDEANSEYTVTLNNAANGIGQFYLHTSKSSLSVKDVNLNNISVYTTDNSTLKIVGLSQGKSDVKLFNLLGKQVFSTSFKSNGVQEISLPKLATGMYIVQVENQTGKLNKKIILE